ALGVSLRKPGVYTLNATGRPAESADTASAQKYASKAVFALVLFAKSAMFSIAVACFAGLSP
ncbi:MAG: cobalamin biosynthesis protein, partial [Polaromonas sp.]